VKSTNALQHNYHASVLLELFLLSMEMLVFATD